MRCPSCEHENPEGSRFCNECGTALDTADGDRRTPAPSHLVEKMRTGGRALEGERKQVTVLFADVMGSMELSEQTDPERWRAIMDRFFAILSDGVHRFEGTVDKFTGDGIMALFGAPIAHEDHAVRACLAALHMRDSLADYAAELRRNEGLNFSVRMGINSGEVVVGSIGDDLSLDYTAIGHTVGLAQRMEQLAEPGKAYLTDATAQLAAGFVELRDLGEFEVKGVSGRPRVHELTGVGTVRTRLDVSRARGFSRFVGRDEEMKVLEEALQRGHTGEGQVVGIVGEPGVGKSRLCAEFVQRCRARGIGVYQAQAQAHAKNVAFLPVLQFLREYFGIDEGDSDQQAREKIAGRITLLEPKLADDLPLLFDFLAVPDPERPVARMDPDARVRQLMEIARLLIHAHNRREPSVNVFEDLHWIDQGSEVFVEALVEAVAGARTLSIVNFRPEYSAPWMEKDHYRQIDLEPLGEDAIEELLTDLLGTDPSLNGVGDLIRTRTGGNPFFIEEVVISLIEAGNLEGERGGYRLVQLIEEERVPASVQAVLAARIDRLGEREKEVLQAASVIGKEFPEPVLAKVEDLERDELDHAVRALLDAAFIYQEAAYPEAIYAFKHPLTQEVAYGSQLGERRARIHGAVAQAIAELEPERLDERAALIAGHWEQAGEEREAARWHARAAAWAGTNAPAQALHHWSKVSELADSLPEGGETATLGVSARTWMLQFGWRLGIESAEANRIFDEADRLTARIPDKRFRAMLLSVHAATMAIAGESTVDEFVDRSLEAISLVEEVGDPHAYLGVSGVPMFALMNAGRYRESIRIGDRAIEVSEGDHSVGAGISVGNPYAFCTMFKGVDLCYLGDLEQGARCIDQALEIARAHGDLETAGWCYEMHVWADYLRGDPEAAIAHGTQSLELAERIGDSFSRTWSRFWLGWGHLTAQNWSTAVDLLEEADRMAAELRTALLGRVPRLAGLAECRLALGEPERALERAREGLALCEKQQHRSAESASCSSLARTLATIEGEVAREEIEALFERAIRSCEETDFRAGLPFVYRNRAYAAQELGDAEAMERDLREAHRLFQEVGATGHVRSLEGELALTG
jgi:class 3 adenylate cyclase/tetratricopeptide (TPR) repeat protein